MTQLNEKIRSVIAKVLGRTIPGVGQGLSAADAAMRAASGDKTGAAIAAAGALPVIGSVAGPVGTVINAVRDIRGSSSTRSPAPNNQQTPMAPGPVPAVNMPSVVSISKHPKPMRDGSNIKVGKLRNDKLKEEKELTDKQKRNKKIQYKYKILDEDNLKEVLSKILEDRISHDANWVKSPDEKKKPKPTKIVFNPELKLTPKDSK